MLAPRSIAAALGLLAFSVSILGGLWVRNPVTAILSRAIWAMIAFSIIGLLAGWVVSIVLLEHRADREKALFTSGESDDDDAESTDPQKTFTQDDPEPMGT